MARAGVHHLSCLLVHGNQILILIENPHRSLHRQELARVALLRQNNLQRLPRLHPFVYPNERSVAGDPLREEFRRTDFMSGHAHAASEHQIDQPAGRTRQILLPERIA